MLHVIQRGETLWQIAQQYRIDFNALIFENPQIQNPDMIFPGQVIIIPAVHNIMPPLPPYHPEC
jgi:morphogenetic protein associated with SpoVID